MNASILRVDPKDQITFNYIPKKYLSAQLHLNNVSDNPLAFKVKTNVPTSYLVKPHFGVLPAKHSIDISITMQPTDHTPQNAAAINDKFLINVIPLPQDTNLVALAELPNFQQVWDSVPKSQIQAHKLKVALRFLESSQNGQDQTPKSSSTPGYSGTNFKDSTTEASEKSLRTSQTSNISYKDTKSNKDDLENSSLMVSFTDSVQAADPRLTQNKSELVSRISTEPTPKPSQKILNEGTTNEVKERREEKERLVQNEALEKNRNIEPQSASTPKEIREESKEPVNRQRNLEERERELEKTLEELMNERRILNQKYNEANAKTEKLNKMLFDLSEENTRLKSELSNIKNSTFKEQSHRKEGNSDGGGYQLWHTLIVAIIAMILGAFLGSN